MLNAILTFLGASFLGIFAWTFQLGNRVSIVEASQTDLPKLINSQFADLSRRLDRIERNIDDNNRSAVNARRV